MIYLLDMLSKSDKSLDQIVDEYERSKYFISGEINSKVPDVQKVLRSNVKDKYAPAAKNVIEVDGINIENERLALQCARF
jgi:hypothetical protein